MIGRQLHMIYVILGMHKSGTTLTSQILHYSGINMGDFDNNISYDQGNKYERESTLNLNQDILEAFGKESIDIFPKTDPTTTSDQIRQMQSIVQSCNERFEDWGFKDPRTCLVYSLWEEMLPEHKLIVIYRSYKESWGRYRLKNLHNSPIQLLRAWKYLKAWLLHNSKILHYLANTTNEYVLLEYRRLMTTQEEYQRLEEFVGRTLTDKRNPKLYRNKGSDSITVNVAEEIIYRQTGEKPSLIMQQLEQLREINIQELQKPPVRI